SPQTIRYVLDRWRRQRYPRASLSPPQRNLRRLLGKPTSGLITTSMSRTPLSPEQDQLLQQEFLRRKDLGANIFLLIRHTGMRIGECADLASDCLRSTGPDQWPSMCRSAN